MPEDQPSEVLHYQLTLNDTKELDYCFLEGENGITLQKPTDTSPKSWMKLEHEQCSNCPLSPKDHPLCPVSVNLSVLLKDWQDIISFDDVSLRVTTKQRTITAKTTAQKALSSLLGLLMATSDCPNTQFFRPMAQFHLPLATAEETTFRAISTHLITQFFRERNGESVDFDLSGLMEVYENMHIVNVSLKKRIESAVENDAALNAVVLLDLFAVTLPYYLDDELEKLKPLFSILLNQAKIA